MVLIQKTQMINDHKLDKILKKCVLCERTACGCPDVDSSYLFMDVY